MIGRLVRRGADWWIENLPTDVGPLGPYRSRKEARKCRRRLQAALRPPNHERTAVMVCATSADRIHTAAKMLDDFAAGQPPANLQALLEVLDRADSELRGLDDLDLLAEVVRIGSLALQVVYTFHLLPRPQMLRHCIAGARGGRQHAGNVPTADHFRAFLLRRRAKIAATILLANDDTPQGVGREVFVTTCGAIVYAAALLETGETPA